MTSRTHRARRRRRRATRAKQPHLLRITTVGGRNRSLYNLKLHGPMLCDSRVVIGRTKQYLSVGLDIPHTQLLVPLEGLRPEGICDEDKTR